ncbi:MAG: hypothetical protein KME21_06855 [Desmonostoc vinosum HA7617-LM4]|jgi:hypothetical protein|nr:hypothetical protein [Desmonostoc vinosum HA7617-LM4]
MRQPNWIFLITISMVLLFIYCGNSFSASYMNIHNPNYSCQEALTLFANKDFSKWQGIPSQCQTNDVFSLYKPINEESVTGKLGSEYTPTFYKACRVENYDEPVKVWFKENAIVKIEVKYPQLSAQQYQAIVKALGEPTEKLDYYFSNFLISQGNWVYAEQGISLFLNTDGTNLIKLSVYYPTSMDDYKKRIRPPFSPAREFPLRKFE